MRTHVIATLAALAVSASACTSSSRSAHHASTTRRTPTSGGASARNAPCPAKAVTDGMVSCGELTVPERHEAPNGKQITIAYAVLHHQGTTHVPDPILWLDFQAGDGFMADRINRFTGEQNPLRANRDIIVLDLRGEGASTPALTCPEYTSLEQNRFVASIPASSSAGRRATLGAIASCRSRLVAQGIDLSAYNTVQTAADLEALRRALHYPAWNIVAGGYGATVALREMQDYPATVRSAVLQDAQPPTADLFVSQVTAMDEAFSALLADCRRDSGCHRAFPNPAGDAARLFAKTASTPVVQPTGFDHAVKFDPTLMADELRNNIGDTTYARALPADLHSPQPLKTFLGFDAAASESGFGDRGIWVSIPPNADSDNGSFALGKHLSVVCSEELPLTSATALANAARHASVGKLFATTGEPQECAQWRVSAVAGDWQPTHITTPVLVLHGDYDPLVPAAGARALANALPHGYFAEVPGVGEYPTYVDASASSTASDCARSLRQSFLNNPGSLKMTCLLSAAGTAFATAPTPTN